MTNTTYRPYAGIGSRQAMPPLCAWITDIATWLAGRGYTLRTGGAHGCDRAFMSGAVNPEVYVPWRGFNGLPWLPFDTEGAERIAARFHPAWSRLSQGARKLHTRNVPQVLGADLASPVEFVLCWTPDGKDSGGTGQAIRIARAHGVPVYNLFHRDDYDRLVSKHV